MDTGYWIRDIVCWMLVPSLFVSGSLDVGDSMFNVGRSWPYPATFSPDQIRLPLQEATLT